MNTMLILVRCSPTFLASKCLVIRSAGFSAPSILLTGALPRMPCSWSHKTFTSMWRTLSNPHVRRYFSPRSRRRALLLACCPLTPQLMSMSPGLHIWLSICHRVPTRHLIWRRLPAFCSTTLCSDSQSWHTPRSWIFGPFGSPPNSRPRIRQV